VKGKVGKSAAKAGSAGSGESHNERTAELGKVKDPNDPDYDPFAEVDNAKKKKETKDPGRDKALKLLMVVGALGIVLAGGILMKLSEEKPYEYVDATNPVRVALNQTVRFEEPWSKVDPPNGRTATRRDGEPYIFHRDNVVEVEWAVPHMQTKCVFLIRGVELGETQFELVYPESRKVKRFTIVVEGDNPHEVAQEQRKVEMRKWSPRELRKTAEDLGSGDTYTKEREVPSREGNFRLAYVEYSRAADAALILRDLLAKEGTVPSDVTELVRRAEEAKSKAETDWEDFINKALAVYRSNLQRESRTECVEQLQRVLRVINHDCDTRFQRLRLILEESWVGEWNGDGTEACTEK
jgi:hypothetical protein